MSGEEVIRIRIEKIDRRGEARWSAMYGETHRGSWRFPVPDLGVGDELVVAVEWRLSAWVPTRIVDSGGRTIIEPERVIEDDEAWSPLTERSEDPIGPGDLIVEVVHFSAPDGTDRTAKKRPCLVVEVGDSEICIRPVHSTGGFLHRSGAGLRLLDWKSAGLANSSVVSADAQYRLVDRPLGPARRIGRLSDRDFERVFGVRRAQQA